MKKTYLSLEKEIQKKIAQEKDQIQKNFKFLFRDFH